MSSLSRDIARPYVRVWSVTVAIVRRTIVFSRYNLQHGGWSATWSEESCGTVRMIIGLRMHGHRMVSVIYYQLNNLGMFSGNISISSQMTQCRIILLLQPVTKLYLFTIELKLRDDFRCFRSKMCFRTFSTVPLNSPLQQRVRII